MASQSETGMDVLCQDVGSDRIIEGVSEILCFDWNFVTMVAEVLGKLQSGGCVLG